MERLRIHLSDGAWRNVTGLPFRIHEHPGIRYFAHWRKSGCDRHIRISEVTTGFAVLILGDPFKTLSQAAQYAMWRLATLPPEAIQKAIAKALNGEA